MRMHRQAGEVVRLFLGAVLLVGLASSPATAEGSWQAFQARAEAAEFRQAYEEALELGDRAYRAASEPEERVRTLLWLGDLYVEYGKAPVPNPPEELLEMDRHALRSYREAIDTARRAADRSEELIRLEVQAVNNLAVLQLEEGKWKEALSELEEVEELASGPELPPYLYNYGLALEQADRWAEAWKRHVDAGRLERGGEWALDRLDHLWKTVPELRTGDRLRDAIEVAVGWDQHERAEEFFTWTLENIQEIPDSEHPALLTALLPLAASRQDPVAELVDRWGPGIDSAGPHLAPAATVRWSELIALCCTPGQPQPAAEPSALAPSWGQPLEDRRRLSHFLENLAHRSYRAGDTVTAYRRFAAAWGLDPQNLDAALYLASLDPVVGSEVDPEAAWMRALGRGLEETDTVSDDAARLRLLLGEAWLARGESEGEEAVADAREKAAQLWTEALESLDNTGGPAYLRVQLLGQRGDVYADLGRTSQAAEDWLSEHTLLRSEGREEQARDVLARASELPELPYSDRIQILQARLAMEEDHLAPFREPPVEVAHIWGFDCPTCTPTIQVRKDRSHLLCAGGQGQTWSDDNPLFDPSRGFGGTKEGLHLTTQPKKRLAVLGFETKAQDVTDEIVGLISDMSERLVKRLGDTGKFVVGEPSRLEPLAEQGLAETVREACDPLPGTPLALVVEVVEAEPPAETAAWGFKRFGVKTDENRAKVRAKFHLVDTTTGAVVSSAVTEGVAEKSKYSMPVSGDRAAAMQGAAQQAADLMVSRIVQEADTIPWQGRIAGVSGDQVVIDAGTDVNIVPGMKFQVLEGSPVLADPETGQLLSRAHEFVGTIEIERVEEGFSVGRVVEGGKISEGQIVREGG